MSTQAPSAKSAQPAQAAQPAQPTQPVKEASGGKNKKVILIIEDDPVLSRMYSEKFSFEGFDVIAARDGEEGLQKALSENIDMIILDIMLPRMSGTDFLERLRQEPKGKNLPVVALTNLTEQQERDKAVKLGVKEYLVKAMQTPEQVVEKIKQYVQ